MPWEVPRPKASHMIFFFFGSDLGKLAKPYCQTVLERSRNQGSGHSSATVVPRLRVVTDMTRR